MDFQLMNLESPQPWTLELSTRAA